MLGYIIRRLAVALIVVIGVAAVVFAILHYLSPTPAYVVLGTKASPVAIASWDQQHGYDRSASPSSSATSATSRTSTSATRTS